MANVIANVLQNNIRKKGDFSFNNKQVWFRGKRQAKHQAVLFPKTNKQRIKMC